MPLPIGSTAVTDVKAGLVAVDRIYLGTDLVYEAPVAATGIPPVNSQSGLTWGSGSSGEMTPQGQFGAWRTRLDDIAVTHVDNNQSMLDLLSYVGTNDPTFYGNWQRHIDISIGAFGKGYDDARTAQLGFGAESWAGAAAGQYDARWTECLQKLRTAVQSRTHPVTGQPPLCFIRFAHEWNADFYPWGIADTGFQPRITADPAKGRPASTMADFKAGWVRFRALQRQHFPEAYVVCNTNREQVNVTDKWTFWMPDADTFDVYGVDYYNHFPYASTDADFTASLTATGPWTSVKGLESHRQLALSLGKPMCISEWSNSADSAAGAGGETVAYLNGMRAFFEQHAGTGPGQLLYECQFNVANEANNWLFYNPSHTIRNPLNAARYKVLWAGGTIPPDTTPTVTKVEDSATGTGVNQWEYVGTWGNTTAEAGDSGSIRYSLSDTSAAVLRVTGPADVEVWGTRETATGIGAWSVDGGATTNVDTYANPTVRGQKLFTASVTSGQHTVRWAATGTKNAASLANTITVDYALVKQPAPAIDRSTLVRETYEPSAATAGIPTGTTLTTLTSGNVPAGCTLNTTTGILTVSTAGTTLTALDIPYLVDVRAANVTIDKCWVRGRGALGTTSQSCVFATHASCVNLIVRDSKIVASPASVYTNGVNGHDFTLLRCEVANVVDFCGIFNTNSPGTAVNVTIDQCWMHDLAYYTSDPTQGGGPSHCDGIQIQGGTGVVIRGNSINAFPGTAGTAQPALTGSGIACLLFNDNVGATGGHTITGNWLRGGDIPVNMRDASTSTTNMGTFHRNKFASGGLHLTPPLTVYRLAGQTLDVGAGTANRNVNLADNTEITVRT